jgi:serine phosphatase RsbU (regulator of sigma subunit)
VIGRSGFSVPHGENAVLLQQLADVTSELGAANTIEAVLDAAVNHMAEAIRAAVTTLMLRDGDELVLVGGHGLRPGILERWHRFPLSDANPSSEAVREARPVMVADRAEIEARYPAMAKDTPPGRSVVCLPLGAVGKPVGAAGLTFDDAWLPGPAELDLLMTFAEACGQAIRRIQAKTEADERARQLQFLANASAELGSSLDYRSTLAKVANLVVPDLADWCAVDIVERGQLTTLAVAHVDPAKVAWAWELQRRYPPDRSAPNGVPQVVRTGVSELYEDISDEMLTAGARDEEHLRLSRELNLRSAIVVPLKVHDHVLGAITFVRAETERRYGAADLIVAEDLGRRAAMAIDNAQLHGATSDVARELSRAVLPERLDEIAGWRVAAHYQPGGEARVGGDFYDAIPLADGRLATFIGDVMGHGVQAAAAMASLRASVRAFASADPAPAAVLDHLQKMFALLSITELVSLVYAVIDPVTASIDFVNAGHYPPVIIAGDGTATFARTPARRPLGTDPDVCRSATFPFRATDTLLLYTDGLVERRREHIDIGLDRIRDSAAVLAEGDLDGALHKLVTEVLGVGGDDDVTALAVRADLASPV